MKFRQFLTFFASVLVLLFSFNSVFSHSCSTFKNLSDKKYAEELDQVGAIFLGEVVSSQRIDMYVQIIELQIVRTWKGIEKQKVSIKVTNSGCWDNEFSFSKGTQLMVYGYDSELIDLNCCNFSLFDDERTKKIYGEGKVIEKPQPSPTSPEPPEGFWSNIWKKITSFFS